MFRLFCRLNIVNRSRRFYRVVVPRGFLVGIVKDEIDSLVVITEIHDFGIATGCSIIEINVHRRTRFFFIKRQVHRTGCQGGANREQRGIPRNLLSHDRDLVPVGTGVVSQGNMQTLRRLDEFVLIAPDEIDFAQLGDKILAPLVLGQRVADQLCCLVVQPVSHVEISLGYRVVGIQVDSSVGAEGLLGRKTFFACRLDPRHIQRVSGIRRPGIAPCAFNNNKTVVIAASRHDFCRVAGSCIHPILGFSDDLFFRGRQHRTAR